MWNGERASSQKKEENNPKVYSGEQVVASCIDVKRYIRYIYVARAICWATKGSDGKRKSRVAWDVVKKKP
jgi:hypothetical protein